MTGPRYVVHVLLKSGTAIEEYVTDAQADDILARNNFTWPAEHDQDWKRRAAITSLLAERLEKQTGLLTVTDAEGGQWLIHASNIDAIRVQDGQDVPDAPAKRPVGFEPLIAQRAAVGSARAVMSSGDRS